MRAAVCALFGTAALGCTLGAPDANDPSVEKRRVSRAQLEEPAVDGGSPARPELRLLGDLPGGAVESAALAVSADGALVVGYSVDGGGERAVQFDDRGLVPLSGARARALAVSPNGRVVAGVVDGAGARWGEDGAPQVLSGGPELGHGLPAYRMTEAGAVFDDGSVLGSCVQSYAYGVPLQCRYDADLRVLGAGRLYAGTAEHSAGEGVPGDAHAPAQSVPTLDGQSLGTLPGASCGPLTGCRGALRAMTPDAATLVGTGRVPAGEGALHDVAIVYDAAKGLRALPDLPGGDDDSGAYAVSADGRVIAGYGSDERGRVAVVWFDAAPQALEDVLLDADRALPDGYTLREVRGLSGDGRTLVGSGVHDDGRFEGFVARLAAAR